MRVCIIGCGAIGSLFASHLGRLQDVEVWAYDPYEPQVEAINKNGLKLTGLSDITVPVNARTDAGPRGRLSRSHPSRPSLLQLASTRSIQR